MDIQQNEVDHENIDLQALAEQDQEQEQSLDEVNAPQLSAVEQKAFDQGWRPESDFSGPEENWKTAKEYVRDGEWMAKMNDLKGQISNQQKQFDQRIDNVNKYNEAQTAAKIKSLQSQQRDAVDMADTEAFDKAQGDIEQLQSEQTKNKVPDPVEQGKDPDIAAWEAKNTWFADINDERGAVAVGVWNTYAQQNPNATTAHALAHVDERINRLYPSANENPRRNQPNTTENNARRPMRKGKTLGMGDLTSAEQSEWKLFGSQMFTEAEFLKTVADTRKK